MSENAALYPELETALRSNGIQVPDGALQELLDRKDWIYPSKRVTALRVKLSPIQLYSTFNSDHHLQSAKELFDFLAKMEEDKVSVVYGQKTQGKSQFLFFVFKLLQAMGEKVIFLDRTALPRGSKKLVHVGHAKFCGHFWKESLLELDKQVKDALDEFYKDKRFDLLETFLEALEEHAESNRTRVWIVVDEVVLFDKFPISLPEEQEFSPFNWIVTGSAGIGSWVAKRHLKKFVWDLPLFTKEQCLEFATKLCNVLGIDLEEGIDGIPFNGVSDWLEERFGGVIGYVAEMFLALAKGESVSQYMSTLRGRVKDLIVKAAGGSAHVKPLSKEWLEDIQSSDWSCIRDAGLCGRQYPRGVILTIILERLCRYSPAKQTLSLVADLRLKFSDDPGLEGCLLELEEILKLKASGSIEVTLLTLIEEGWVTTSSIVLPSKVTPPLNVFRYNETSSKLEKTGILTKSSWRLIEIPSGFDVIDVALVNLSDAASPAIYGIQITRSMNPFAKHHTFDTCSARSKARLEKLWSVIINYFQLDVDVAKHYVMLAPNCVRDEFKPPVGHTSDYFFSPVSVVIEYDPLIKRKRSNSLPVPVRQVRSKPEPEPPSTKRCCRCKSGNFTKCKCAKEKRSCNPDCVCRNGGMSAPPASPMTNEEAKEGKN